MLFKLCCPGEAGLAFCSLISDLLFDRFLIILSFLGYELFPLLSPFCASLLITALSDGDEPLEVRKNEESISCYFHILCFHSPSCLRLTFLVQQQMRIHIIKDNKIPASFYHHDINERTPSSKTTGQRSLKPLQRYQSSPLPALRTRTGRQTSICMGDGPINERTRSSS